MADTDRYYIPATPTRVELRFANSRFIGSATYTPTIEAARDYIAQIRAEMPGATHHVYAYVVGHGATVTAGMSDAGEPSGTAGRPALAVLRGSGLGDTTVVITRFFGGTLLGTGGLVKAYSSTTKAVLDEISRAEHVEQQPLTIRVGYSSYALACQVLEAHQATVINEDFAVEVTLTVSLPLTQVDGCVDELSTVTSGQAVVEYGKALS